MNIANKVTMFRVFLIPVFLIVYISDLLSDPVRSYVAVAIFIIASLTDWLDGYLARTRNLITNFGKFMDPLADKLLVSAAMIVMIEKGLLPSWVVVIILSREFIVTGLRMIAASANKVIAASLWGKIKTNLQMIMIVYIMLEIKGRPFQIIGNALIFLTVALTLLSAIDYISKNTDVLKG